MREAFDECGYGWVTSHVFRKTVSTHLDQSGVSTTEGADQLGDTPTVYEERYRKKRRKATNRAAMEALESIEKAPEAK
ncbi:MULTISPECIES: transposase [Amycolatopsis]|uniref:Transposase n=1 Tax=Amycolatopsis dendrobii TaxID=2760662 RepID=A0A7W3W217_9PSEU|nr:MULTISPECIES: transposase [Amycolatopsis]MBB1157403.1 transposase [Amycolatopsis dendrobii]UKD59200.1 hypothetical protein L3Q65_21565 [Amycolatopsis sp. FU40]